MIINCLECQSLVHGCLFESKTHGCHLVSRSCPPRGGVSCIIFCLAIVGRLGHPNPFFYPWAYNMSYIFVINPQVHEGVAGDTDLRVRRKSWLDHQLDKH
jgi:hypothetical protein